MRTKSGFLSASMILLSIFLTGPAADAQSALSAGTSCLLQATPFYNRLLAAGVFDVPVIRVDDPRPAVLLFKMARTFRYSSDKKKTDKWQSAEQTSLYFQGDCEDKAIWLYAQLRRNGYDNVSLHIGKYGPSSAKFHMWVTYVDENGKTLLLDPTMQRKAWDVNAFPKRNYRSLHILTGQDCVSL